MASVFKRAGFPNYFIGWTTHDGRRREKSSRTTDRKVAERIGAQLDAQAALRREGVIDPRQDRYFEANAVPLLRHVDAYLEHLRAGARAAFHVSENQRLLNRIIAATGAARLSDLTPDALARHLKALRDLGRSATTVNMERTIVVSFVNWAVKSGRVRENLLKQLPRLDQNRDRRRIRRALTWDEISSLLTVAAKHGRRPVYLCAALAGLRRSELTRLRWADVDLAIGTLTISDGKAHRTDVLPLHPQLKDALTAIRPDILRPDARVFPVMPSNDERRADFEDAGIVLKDVDGRVADLHSLRVSLGTNLARLGVSPAMTQRMLRHADYKITMKHYIQLDGADVAKAIQSVPNVPEAATSSVQVAQQRATGTEGAEASQASDVSPQHPPREPPYQPPQMERETLRGGSSGREGRGRSQRSALSGNSLPMAALRDPTRADAFECDGSPRWTRTTDPLINSQML